MQASDLEDGATVQDDSAAPEVSRLASDVRAFVAAHNVRCVGFFAFDALQWAKPIGVRWRAAPGRDD